MSDEKRKRIEERSIERRRKRKRLRTLQTELSKLEYETRQRSRLTATNRKLPQPVALKGEEAGDGLSRWSQARTFTDLAPAKVTLLPQGVRSHAGRMCRYPYRVLGPPDNCQVTVSRCRTLAPCKAKPPLLQGFQEAAEPGFEPGLSDSEIDVVNITKYHGVRK